MKAHILVFSAALAAGFLVGCDKGVSLPSKEAVVVVGSHTLTDPMVKSRVALMQELRVRKNPKMTAQELGKFRELMSKTYPRFFVVNAVQEDYAVKEGLTIPEDRVATNRQMIFRAYHAKGEKTYEDMLKALGEESAAELEQQIRSEALSAEVKAHFLKLNPPDIKPDYADKEIAKMLEQNRVMSLTNTLIYARATNVWEQLKKGGDFVTLAEKYTEIAAEKEDKGYWGEFDPQQLSHEPAVVRFGRRAKPGEYTAPIEADNGLMILRLNSRVKDDAGVEQFNFSRIFFLLPEFYLPAPKDAIMRAAHERYADELYERKLKGLVEAAKPVYRNERAKKSDNEKEGK